MQTNGHDLTATAEATQRLAAEQKQQAAQAEYQKRAMPLMLQAVTEQRNQALSQLALAQAELTMVRAEYDTLLAQNEAHTKEIAEVRAELQAVITSVGAAADVPASGATDNP